MFVLFVNGNKTCEFEKTSQPGRGKIRSSIASDFFTYDYDRVRPHA